MTEARFLQIHTLHSYSSVLLNRDDSGLAKRLPYGGVMRTRISSQCLKRHWRIAEDPHALSKIAGATDAFRSRELVTVGIIEKFRKHGVPEELLKVLEPSLQRAVYGKEGDKGKSKRQTLLFGAPELAWLSNEASALLKAAEGDPKILAESLKDWEAKFRNNIKVMRDQAKLDGALHGGLAAALFGRMVTSDPAANIDAPIHVAHAFTVHCEETESDYLTAVDDLKKDDDDQGADTIQEAELTSGLFYGYVVVDIPGLVSNTTGCDRKD
jgi:CRISPR system Cascade subunit CasC